MKLLPVLVCFALAAGCAGGDAPPDAATPTGDCNASAAAARERVAKVASENAACSTDADCVVVGVRASCFDACSASVNLTGKGAVDRASTLVEAAECKAFHQAGCQLVIPPCAPPQPAKCVSGTCR
jgi:hypothetical protein